MNDRAQVWLDAIQAVPRLLAAVRGKHGIFAMLLAHYRGRADIAEVPVVTAPTLDAFDATAAGDLRQPSEVHCVTETTTRLPQGAPLPPNADAAALPVVISALLIAATLQLRWLRAQRPEQT